MPDWKRDALFRTAHQYCRLRLLPIDELSYAEHCDYGTRRSRLHNSICNLLDADREVVEHAFAKVESQFGFKVDGGCLVDGSAHGNFDFAKAYDAFCKELERIDGLSDRERHPNVLSPEDLDKMDFSGLSGLPDMRHDSLRNETLGV